MPPTARRPRPTHHGDRDPDRLPCRPHPLRGLRRRPPRRSQAPGRARRARQANAPPLGRRLPPQEQGRSQRPRPRRHPAPADAYADPAIVRVDAPGCAGAGTPGPRGRGECRREEAFEGERGSRRRRRRGRPSADADGIPRQARDGCRRWERRYGHHRWERSKHLGAQADVVAAGGLSAAAVLESTASAADDQYAWADRYRPSVLGEFIWNKAVADELHRLVIEHGCNHFIFEGRQAVGKRSMVLALLRDAFGPDNLQIHERSKRIELRGEFAKHIDVKVKISGHHVEVNLADLHGYENHVITTLLNESILPADSMCDHTNCKVIVVHDADRLSPDFQHYIGWFLGRYAGCNKIIFCCSDSSNLEAVKHLCKVIKLQTPSFDEMIKVLEFIAMKEGIDLPRGIASRIAVSASNNLRQAIRSFEATWKANHPFIEGQPILTGWEEEIYNVAKKIMEEPSPKQLYLIRGKIRKMIEHNVSPYFIFRHLVTELKRDRDKDFQNSIDELASELNHCADRKFQKEQHKEYRSRDESLDLSIEQFAVEGHDQGEAIQYFMKIEEFTVRFMSFYRSYRSEELE